MALIHIVLFQFKAGTSPDAVQKIVSQVSSLKESCVHPESQKPYIKSLTGGKNVATEGLSDGFQYGLVMEFESPADRDYYVKEDPAHVELVANLKEGDIIEKAVSVDYNVGQF